MFGIQSLKVYSVQKFLEIMTGKTFTVHGDNDILFIHKILTQEKIEDDEYPIFDYSLDAIKTIIDDNTYVVLVDCLVWNEEDEEYNHEYRWFECGDDFKFKEEEL